MDDYLALIWSAEAEAQADPPVTELRQVTSETGVYGWFVVETNRGPFG